MSSPLCRQYKYSAKQRFNIQIRGQSIGQNNIPAYFIVVNERTVLIAFYPGRILRLEQQRHAVRLFR